MKNILDEIASEGIGGGLPDHYFDETRDPNYGQNLEPERRPLTESERNLPPIRYTLRLVRREDGSLNWDED